MTSGIAATCNHFVRRTLRVRTTALPRRGCCRVAVLGLALAAAVLATNTADAATIYTWTGATSNDFWTGSNWTSTIGGVPADNSSSRLQIGTTATPTPPNPLVFSSGTITLKPNERGFLVGNGGGTNAEFTISGGSFTTSPTSAAGTDHLDVIGNNGGTGVLNVTNDAIYTSNFGVKMGNVNGNGTGTFNISDSAQAKLKTLVMGGTSTVNLNGGTLTLSGFSSGNVVAATFNFNGGTLKAGTANFTLGGITSANVKGSGAIVDTDGGRTITISQALLDGTGGGGLTKNGLGTLILSGANTFTGAMTLNAGTLTVSGENAYTGTTNINAGTLQANHASALGNGGNITFAGGTLQYMANSAGQDWGARINRAAAIALDTNGQNATVTTIDGTNTGGLTKSGAGTLTLAGTNAYTGLTAVNAGRLNLTGTIASDVTIADGVNLGGEGSTSSAITFNGASLWYFDPSSSAYLTASTVVGSGATVTLVPTAGATGTGIVVVNAPAGILGSVGSSPTDNFQFSGRGSIYFNDASHTQILMDYAAASLKWRGNDDTNPTFWDVDTTANWHNTVTAAADKFFGGDTLTFDDTATSYNVVVQGASVNPGNMTFDNSATAYTVSGGSIAGLGSLTKNGTAALTLSGANSYTGGTTLNAGTLNVNNATALGAASGGLVINGGTLDNTSAAAVIANSYPLTINSDFTFTGTQDLNLGAGATTLGTEAGTARTITVSAGTLTLGGAIANGTTANGIVKAGAGTLALTGTNTFTGPVSILDGTLSIIGDAQLGAVPAAAMPGAIVLADGSKLSASGGAAINANRGMTLAGNGTLEILGADGSYRGVITGPGQLTLHIPSTGTAGAFGALTSNYSGGTVLPNGSRFSIMDSTTGPAGSPTAGPFGTGTIIINDVSLRSTTGEAKTVGNAIILQGNLTMHAPGSSTKNLTLSGPITIAGGSRTITNNAHVGTPSVIGTLILSGAIGEDAPGRGLTFAGPDPIRLSGANTYTGATNFSGGIVQANHAGAFGTGGDITFGGGTLQYTAASAATDWAARFKNSTAAIRLDSNGQYVTLAGAIDTTNTAGLTKLGAGTVALSGANAYTGTTTVSAGVLSIANTAALPGWNVGGSYSVAANAGLAVGNAVTDGDVATILATGNFLPSANFGFDTSAGNRTYSVALADSVSGTLGLVKVGAGILTLDQTNTYTGVTTVSEGTLSVAGTASLPGWDTALRYSVTANAALAAGNAVTDTEITTMLGTGNFAVNSAVGFDTSAGDRTYATVLANTAAGALGLAKVGANTLVLNQANTYTGPTLIRNGALQLTGGDNRLVGTTSITLGDVATSGKLILGDAAGPVNQTFGAVMIGAFGLGGNVVGGNAAVSTLTVGSGTIAVPLGGAGTDENNLALVKNTTGNLTLTAASTHTGGTTVSNGNLYLKHTGDANPAIRGDVTVTGNSTGELRGRLYLQADNQLESTATVHAIPGGYYADLALGGFSQTLAGFTVSGAGTAIIQNYQVEAITNPGTLTFNNSSDITLGSNVWVRNGSATGTGSLTVIKDGPGAITVGAGIVTNTGGWTLKNGILKLGGNNFVSTVPLRLEGGTLSSSSTGARTVSGNVSFDADMTLGDAVNTGTVTLQTGAATLTATRQLTVNSTVVINQAIGESAAGFGITKLGSGTLALGGVNTYTGPTDVQAGTLRVASAAAIPAASAVSVTNAGSTLAVNFGGPADLDAVQVAVILSQTTFASTTTYLSLDTTSAPGAAIYGESLSMAASLLKNSPGTLVLAGANSYTGLTDVQVGALRVANAAGLGAAAVGTVVANDARLELSGDVTVSGEALTISGRGGVDFYNGALNSYSGVNTWAGDVTIAAVDTRIGAQPGATLIVSGVIDSDGNPHGLIVKPEVTAENALATVVLSGANTYVGDTTVVGGAVKLDGGDNRLPVGTTLKVGTSTGSGTFDLNGRNQEVAGLVVGQTGGTYTNTVTNGSGTPSVLTVNAAAAPSTYSGVLAGNLALTKKGVDTLTLSGDNTYTGATLVAAGTLTASGRLTGTSGATVDAGAALALSNPAASVLLPATAVVNNGALSVSAAGQELGALSGAGDTTVADGASLSAASIVQNTLTIGAGASVVIRETTGAAAGASAVPEPSLVVLLLTAGAIGLAVRARRRK